ncbi:MAG: hypothetical protein WAU58_16945 [Terriglobales bacterium]
MTFRRAALLIFVAAVATMLAACGSSSSTTQPISLAFTPAFTPPGSMTIGGTAGIAVTITNGPQNATVNWSCTPASQCGSFSPASTASTVPTTYTAPTTVPSPATVTITATSGTASVTATINITSSISLAFTTPPPSSMATSSTANLAATITNGPPNATVNWTVTCGSAQCGSFNPTSTASTVPTTYTAPTSVPTGGTVTITATSANDSSKSIQATITITTTAITITFTSGSTPPSSMLISGAANIAATVTGDPSNAGVNWTVTCSSAQCGGFNPTNTASAATTQFTAPAAVPTGTTVTVTATSAANSSVFVQATITITSNVTVAFTSTPPVSVLIDSNTNLAATVNGDPGNAGVNWSCTPASLCGTFTPTSTLSTVATSYAAPSAVPVGNSVTVTATSVDDYTKTASATITVTSNITVAFTPTFLPPASMNTNTQQEIAAFTTNDPTNAGVNWTVTCGSAGQCGTFGQTPTLNNVPTNYTAPLAVPTGTTVTVTATSVSDFNKSKSANITITQPITTLPDGTYVFQVGGEDNNQQSPFYVAGAFTIQSGAITGGEQDFTDLFLGASSYSIYNDSTIALTTDGNLQIALDVGSDQGIGVNNNGFETLNVALVTPSTGLVTWFDGFASGNGTIALQDPIAAQTLPNYGYAFVTSGADLSAAPLVMGGIINVDDATGAGTISGSGSVFDINDGSAIAPEPDQPLAGSTVAGPGGGSAPDSYGKVVFTLNPNANPAVLQIVLAGYIIDANTITLVEAADTFGGATGGIALAQGQANTGNFGTANLSGSSYVVGSQGEDDFFFLDFAGALTFNSDATVSGTADFNDQQNADSLASVTGTYVVDSTGISDGTGRVTITNFTGTDLNYNPNTDTPEPATLQLYLDGNGNALMASMDPYDFTAGPAFQQTASASLSGTYALSGAGVSDTCFNNWSAVGPITIGGSGIIGSGSFTDFDYLVTTPPVTGCGFATSTYTDVPLTGTASTPNGPITGLGADSIAAGPPFTSNTFDFFVIDGLRAFGIETDLNTQTGLLYLQAPPAQKPHAKAHK